ncbi:hypothetical protein FB008_12040 [Sinorhizobium medicae]|nr:hypothetical protein FB008_12040 [Sinorhizobium medicae]
MSQDYRPPGSGFPGFVILVAIAALIGALVSVRQPTQAARVWVPASTGASNSIRNVGATCAPQCRSIDPA